MERAFVTGGSGFIGGRLIARLAGEGIVVRALARSEASAQKVAGLGAEAVRGDLSDEASIEQGAQGCDTAFHSAAHVEQWGPWEDFVAGNVDGTRNALAGCRAAGVRRFVHVGTEAALMAGQPLVNVGEDAPLRPDSPQAYPATKAQAEQLVRAADGNEMQTVVVRPRLVWGPGDTTILPGLVAAVKAGRFSWIGGGTHLTDTTHVDNVVEGLVLAAERGARGAAYFVTDGEPIEFREFVTALLATQGIEPPDRSVPAWLAASLAPMFERAWKALRRQGEPPLTRLVVWLSSQECTLDITRARRELGYAPVISREQGLAALGAPA